MEEFFNINIILICTYSMDQGCPKLRNFAGPLPNSLIGKNPGPWATLVWTTRNTWHLVQSINFKILFIQHQMVEAFLVYYSIFFNKWDILFPLGGGHGQLAGLSDSWLKKCAESGWTRINAQRYLWATWLRTDETKQGFWNIFLWKLKINLVDRSYVLPKEKSH